MVTTSKATGLEKTLMILSVADLVRGGGGRRKSEIYIIHDSSYQYQQVFSKNWILVIQA